MDIFPQNSSQIQDKEDASRKLELFLEYSLSGDHALYVCTWRIMRALCFVMSIYPDPNSKPGEVVDDLDSFLTEWKPA
jgi:hypothetical protein